MSIHLISFADSRLFLSAQRFKKEAEEFGAFDKISVYSEKDFSSEFISRFSEQLKPGVRGFGYWAWKPWIIQSEMDQLKTKDILIYADIGFTINPNGSKRFTEYVKRVKSSNMGVLGFQAKRPEPGGPVFDDGRSLPEWREKYFSKGDLIDYFGVRNNSKIIETPQIQAGLICFKKNEKSISFVNEWLNIFMFDFNLINDSPSASPNCPGFREHRHDQSLFSILGKLKGIETLPSCEFWMPHWWSSIPDWKPLIKTPFHQSRKLNFNPGTRSSGTNTDITKRVSFRSLIVNLKLLGKRILNLFKPFSKRYL